MLERSSIWQCGSYERHVETDREGIQQKEKNGPVKLTRNEKERNTLSVMGVGQAT